MRNKNVARRVSTAGSETPSQSQRGKCEVRGTSHYSSTHLDWSRGAQSRSRCAVASTVLALGIDGCCEVKRETTDEVSALTLTLTLRFRRSYDPT